METINTATNTDKILKAILNYSLVLAAVSVGLSAEGSLASLGFCIIVVTRTSSRRLPASGNQGTETSFVLVNERNQSGHIVGSGCIGITVERLKRHELLANSGLELREVVLADNRLSGLINLRLQSIALGSQSSNLLFKRGLIGFQRRDLALSLRLSDYGILLSFVGRAKLSHKLFEIHFFFS